MSLTIDSVFKYEIQEPKKNILLNVLMLNVIFPTVFDKNPLNFKQSI